MGWSYDLGWLRCTIYFGVLGILMPHLSGATRLVITPNGQQVKRIGSGIICTCSLVDMNPNEEPTPIRWIRQDGTIIIDTRGSGNHRVYIEQADAFSQKLYINRIASRDAGLYKCQTTQRNGIVLNGQVEIILYEEITFLNTPRSVEHRIGSSPLIPCQATGRPGPIITWRFQRQRIIDGDGKYSYEDGGLRIQEISEADNGTYECRAEVESQGSLNMRPVVLSVMFPPKITRAPEPASVVQGRRITLRCQAIGNPVPEYEWYKEVRFSDLVKVKVRLDKNVRHKTSHTIESATAEDEGTYFCTARNDLGVDEVQADVSLMIPPEIDDLPFKIQGQGDIMELPCYARGIPTPDVTWQKVGNPHPYREGEQRHDSRLLVDNTEQGVSRLKITGTLPEDSGFYTCIASNPAGIRRRNTTITVQFEPTILTRGVEEHAWAGESRTFNCTAQGLPEPDITWFRGEIPLRPDSTHMIVGKRGSSLMQVNIPENDESVYGKLSCMAKNIRGYELVNFHLTKAEPPSRPRNVTILDETPVTVTLVANEPTNTGGLGITSWMIQYEQSRQGNMKTKFFGTGEKMTVSGLEPENTYDFYLAAGNPAGFGKSIKFKVRTPRIAPTLPPMPIPIRTDPPPMTQPEEPSLSNSSQLGAKQPKPPENIPVYKSSESTEPALPMALILGGSCAVVFLILLLFIIILIVRRKKKRNDHPYGVKSVVKSNSQDFDSMQLSIRRKNSPLPIPPATPKMGERQTAAMEARLHNGMNGHAIHAHTSPRLSRDERPMSDVPTLNVVTSNSAARAAWDFMLQHKDLDTSDDEIRDSDGDIPLPPPPPELSSPPYILGSNTLPQVNAKYRQGNGRRHHDYQDVYQDIFDGYHSGDNIDSEIEEVTDELRLQLPSYSDLNLGL